jgi:hypothetical protein
VLQFLLAEHSGQDYPGKFTVGRIDLDDGFDSVPGGTSKQCEQKRYGGGRIQLDQVFVDLAYFSLITDDSPAASNPYARCWKSISMQPRSHKPVPSAREALDSCGEAPDGLWLGIVPQTHQVQQSQQFPTVCRLDNVTLERLKFVRTLYLQLRRLFPQASGE